MFNVASGAGIDLMRETHGSPFEKLSKCCDAPLVGCFACYDKRTRCTACGDCAGCGTPIDEREVIREAEAEADKRRRWRRRR